LSFSLFKGWGEACIGKGGVGLAVKIHYKCVLVIMFLTYVSFSFLVMVFLNFNFNKSFWKLHFSLFFMQEILNITNIPFTLLINGFIQSVGLHLI